jgi:hypothetical protein
LRFSSNKVKDVQFGLFLRLISDANLTGNFEVTLLPSNLLVYSKRTRNQVQFFSSLELP